MELFYCGVCGSEFEEDELLREKEPHGEWLLWTPCCHEGPTPEDEYDPTPYCNGCGARQKKDCECGPFAKND